MDSNGRIVLVLTGVRLTAIPLGWIDLALARSETVESDGHSTFRCGWDYVKHSFDGRDGHFIRLESILRQYSRKG